MARFAWKLRAAVYGPLILGTVSLIYLCTSMPGMSARVAHHEASAEHRALSARLKRDVEILSTQFIQRNLDAPQQLQNAISHLTQRLHDSGIQQVTRELVHTPDGDAHNLVGIVPGTNSVSKLAIVGAHYDTAPDTAGANDNGSGVASLLALASRFSQSPADRTLRFVLFANEEPPYFGSRWMGSMVHAVGCQRRGEAIEYMISLETMGYYSNVAGSQRYPFPAGLFYPTVGNFVAFVGNLSSRALVRGALTSFRGAVDFPSEGAAFPEAVAGVGWSDHSSFWRIGVPALMVTDTALYRDPHYHKSTDSAEHLDFDSLATVVLGVEAVLRGL